MLVIEMLKKNVIQNIYFFLHTLRCSVYKYFKSFKSNRISKSLKLS